MDSLHHRFYVLFCRCSSVSVSEASSGHRILSLADETAEQAESSPLRRRGLEYVCSVELHANTQAETARRTVVVLGAGDVCLMYVVGHGFIGEVVAIEV